MTCLLSVAMTGKCTSHRIAHFNVRLPQMVRAHCRVQHSRGVLDVLRQGCKLSRRSRQAQRMHAKERCVSRQALGMLDDRRYASLRGFSNAVAPKLEAEEARGLLRFEGRQLDANRGTFLQLRQGGKIDAVGKIRP